MSEDDAFSRANRFLTVRKSTELAISDSDIDDLLKDADESTRPKPVETKARPAPPPQKSAPAPASHPPPAVSAPKNPGVTVQAPPGVTAEVLPPESPAQSGQDGKNINVVVNVQQAPVVHPYPSWWWGYGYPYPYYPPAAICGVCGEHARRCGRWRCPY
jgi:hypothetical protein